MGDATTKDKIESFQALRMFACIGVVVSHLGITYLSPWGHWGVSTFFILSGFLMAYRYEDRKLDASIFNNIKFSYGKIAKSYPLHLFTMLMMIALWFVGDKTELQRTFHPIKTIILNIFLIQNWLPSNREINSVAWFLSALLLIYMLFPWFNLRKDSKTAFVDLVLLTASQVVLPGLFVYYIKLYITDYSDMVLWFTYYCPFVRSLDFFIGCNLYKIYETRKNSGSDLRVLYYFLIIFGIFISLIPQKASWWWIGVIPYTFPSCALVMVFSSDRYKLSYLLINKFTIFIGNISQNIFLIHMVVFYYIDSVIHLIFGRYDYNWVPVIKLIFGFPTIILLSYSWDRIYKIVRMFKDKSINLQ